MSPGQIAQWLAYQEVRGPLGSRRWDLYAAMILYMLSGDSEKRAEDFLPQWREDPRLRDPEAFYDAVMTSQETPA